MSTSPPLSKTALNPCTELSRKYSDDTLLFAAKAESNRKQVAAKKAEKESLIQLVQFFQSEFIEGEQMNLFASSERLGNQARSQTMKGNGFSKEWAETSYEMIGSQHNQNAFTHNQKILQDSTGYIAYNMLEVSNDWIRNHWKESLAATDSSFYQNVEESKYHKEIMEMDIRQQPPCKNF